MERLNTRAARLVLAYLCSLNAAWARIPGKKRCFSQATHATELDILSFFRMPNGYPWLAFAVGFVGALCIIVLLPGL